LCSSLVKKRGELDPAVDIRSRRKKDSPFVLSCIDKKIKKTVPVGAKSENLQRARQGSASSFGETEGMWQKREL